MGLLAILTINIGCVSSYNHFRVQNNLAKRSAVLFNDQDALRYMSAGIAPRQAVQLSAMANANNEVDGVKIMIQPRMLGGYLTTFKEAPLATGLSLLADAALSYGFYYVGDKNDWKINSSSSGNGSKPDDDVNQNATGSQVVQFFIDGDGNEVVTSTRRNDE